MISLPQGQQAAVPPLHDDPLHGIGRQGAWLVASSLLPGLYSVLLVAYMLHTLGPEQYAPWAALVAVLGWLTFLDAGLMQTTVRGAARAIAGEREAIDGVLTGYAAYAVLGVLAGLLGGLLALAVPVVLSLRGPTAVEAVLVGALLAVDLAVVTATAGWVATMRGARRFDVMLRVNAVQVAVALAIAVPLVPTFGLIGAAIAQPTGRICARLLLSVLLRRQLSWFRARPGRPALASLRALWGFSLPIMAIQFASQLGIGTDLIIVGATSGATALGLFAAGSQFVRFAALFLLPATGVVLPAFSATAYLRPHLIGPLVARSQFLLSVTGAVIFGLIALEAATLVPLWSGQAAELSVTVTVIYAVTYVFLTPVHTLGLMLIATGRQGPLAVLMLAEAAVNLCLSLVLVQTLGPLGVALSTLIVASTNRVLFVPLLTGRQLRVPVWGIIGASAAGLLLGAAIVLLVQVVAIVGVAGTVVRAGLAAMALMATLWLGLRLTRPGKRWRCRFARPRSELGRPRTGSVRRAIAWSVNRTRLPWLRPCRPPEHGSWPPAHGL
ncbi:hypothetical protein BH20CHL6_BH20CHL6_04650 [soil metagenome]